MPPHGATFLGRVSGEVSINVYVFGGNIYINTIQAESDSVKSMRRELKHKT
jgi:hypothetical protein